MRLITSRILRLGTGANDHWSPQNPNVKGLKLIGRYGANAEHTLFFIVETDDVNALHKFLWPGFERCTSTITPVSEVPVPKD